MSYVKWEVVVCEPRYFLFHSHHGSGRRRRRNRCHRPGGMTPRPSLLGRLALALVDASIGPPVDAAPLPITALNSPS